MVLSARPGETLNRPDRAATPGPEAFLPGVNLERVPEVIELGAVAREEHEVPVVFFHDGQGQVSDEADETVGRRERGIPSHYAVTAATIRAPMARAREAASHPS